MLIPLLHIEEYGPLLKKAGGKIIAGFKRCGNWCKHQYRHRHHTRESAENDQLTSTTLEEMPDRVALADLEQDEALQTEEQVQFPSFFAGEKTCTVDEHLSRQLRDRHDIPMSNLGRAMSRFNSNSDSRIDILRDAGSENKLAKITMRSPIAIKYFIRCFFKSIGFDTVAGIKSHGALSEWVRTLVGTFFITFSASYSDDYANYVKYACFTFVVSSLPLFVITKAFQNAYRRTKNYITNYNHLNDANQSNFLSPHSDPYCFASSTQSTHAIESIVNFLIITSRITLLLPEVLSPFWTAITLSSIAIPFSYYLAFSTDEFLGHVPVPTTQTVIGSNTRNARLKQIFYRALAFTSLWVNSTAGMTGYISFFFEALTGSELVWKPLVIFGSIAAIKVGIAIKTNSMTKYPEPSNKWIYASAAAAGITSFFVCANQTTKLILNMLLINSYNGHTLDINLGDAPSIILSLGAAIPGIFGAYSEAKRTSRWLHREHSNIRFENHFNFFNPVKNQEMSSPLKSSLFCCIRHRNIIDSETNLYKKERNHQIDQHTENNVLSLSLPKQAP